MRSGLHEHVVAFGAFSANIDIGTCLSSWCRSTVSLPEEVSLFIELVAANVVLFEVARHLNVIWLFTATITKRYVIDSDVSFSTKRENKF